MACHGTAFMYTCFSQNLSAHSMVQSTKEKKNDLDRNYVLHFFPSIFPVLSLFFPGLGEVADGGAFLRQLHAMLSVTDVCIYRTLRRSLHVARLATRDAAAFSRSIGYSIFWGFGFIFWNLLVQSIQQKRKIGNWCKRRWKSSGELDCENRIKFWKKLDRDLVTPGGLSTFIVVVCGITKYRSSKV